MGTCAEQPDTHPAHSDMTPKPIDTRTMRLIGLVGFTSMASMRLCDGMLVALGLEFSISLADAALVVSVFTVTYGVMQLFYGPLGDRLGKLRVVVAAAFACALFSVLMALASSFTAVVLARAAMGASAAGIVPQLLAWLGDNTAYEQRQAALARLMGATVSGMMVGGWFGGVAPDLIGWRPAFVLLALLFAGGAWALHRHNQALMHDESTPAAKAQTVSFFLDAAGTLDLLHRRRVRWVLAVTGVEGALLFGVMALAPTHVALSLGVSMGMASQAVLLFGVGGLLYSRTASRLLPLLGEQGLSLAGGALMATGLLLLAWAGHMLLASVGCLFTGLGYFMLHNTLQTQATQMAPAARGRAVTLFACTLFFGQSLGVSGMAHSVDGGLLPWAFSAAALGLLVLGAVVRSGVGPAAVHDAVA